MRDFFARRGQALQVGVARDGLCLVRRSRWGRAGAELLAEQVCTESGIGVALAGLLAGGGLAGMPVSFVLADDLLRLWQVTPPPGVSRLGDLEAAAALRFQTLYGESISGWKVTADWHSDLPFCAAAVPLPLLALLEQGAAAQQLALVAVVPHFIDAWNRWQGALKAGAWFAQVSGGAAGRMLTLGVTVARGRLHAVRPLPLPSSAEALALALQREALLLDVPAPTLLQVGGDMPAGFLASGPAGRVAVQRLGAATVAGRAPLSAAAALVWTGALA